MDKYLKEINILTWKIGIAIAILCGFVDFRFSLSLLVGLVFATLNSYLNSLFYTNLLSTKEKFQVSRFILIFLANMGLIIIPLSMGIFINNWFNVYFVAAGLLINKIMIYIQGVFKKSEVM